VDVKFCLWSCLEDLGRPYRPCMPAFREADAVLIESQIPDYPDRLFYFFGFPFTSQLGTVYASKGIDDPDIPSPPIPCSDA